MSPKNVLVIGATGKQGGALIDALLNTTEASESTQYHVYACTRKAINPSAQALADKYPRNQLTIVQGDLDVPETIARIFEGAKDQGGIWGVFVALAFPGLGEDATAEERQGKMLADLSLEYGVKSFIYSSAMRAGPKYEDQNTLDAKAKADIEESCIKLGQKGLPWTILKPGVFMETFDGSVGAITASVLKKGLGEATTVGFIASEDIGNVAAGVFQNHEKYLHKTLAVVAEYCTMTQLAESYHQATNSPMPAIPMGMGWLILKLNRSLQNELISVVIPIRVD